MDEFTILNGEPISFSYGAIAAWDGDGNYAGGGAEQYVRNYGVTNLTVTATGFSAQRFGDGGLMLASYAKNSGATVQLAWAGDLSSIALLLNAQLQTSGVGENQIRSLKLLGGTRRYIGFIGAADLDDGTKNGFHVFAPKLVMTSDSVPVVQIQGGQEAEYGIVTIDLIAMPDENYMQGVSDEIHNFTLGSPTEGNYTLSFGASTTDPIAYNATASDIQTALRNLPNIGPSGVSVATAVSGGFNVTFTGRYKNAKVQLLVGTGISTGTAFDGVITVTRASTGNRGQALIIAMYEVPAGLTPLLPPSFEPPTSTP